MRTSSLPRRVADCAWLKERAARFLRSEGGATAVEFALVGVPFLGLLAAIFETALVFFANQGLESAVTNAARTILTGQVQGDAQITSWQQFRDQMICNPTAPMQRSLPSFIDCSKIIVDVRPASSFSSADTSNDLLSISPEYCTGGPGDIVVVRALYPMPVYFSILESVRPGEVSVNRAGQTYYGTGFVHPVEGTAAFRNEPFPGYTGPSAGC